MRKTLDVYIQSYPHAWIFRHPTKAICHCEKIRSDYLILLGLNREVRQQKPCLKRLLVVFLKKNCNNGKKHTSDSVRNVRPFKSVESR
jgi:hypothetical protein